MLQRQDLFHSIASNKDILSLFSGHSPAFTALKPAFRPTAKLDHLSRLIVDRVHLLSRRKVRVLKPLNLQLFLAKKSLHSHRRPQAIGYLSAVPMHGCNNHHFLTGLEFLNQIIDEFQARIGVGVAFTDNAAKLKFLDRFLWLLRVEVFDDCEQLGVILLPVDLFQFAALQNAASNQHFERVPALYCAMLPWISRTKYRSQVRSLLSNKLASSHQITRPRAAS